MHKNLGRECPNAIGDNDSMYPRCHESTLPDGFDSIIQIHSPQSTALCKCPRPNGLNGMGQMNAPNVSLSFESTGDDFVPVGIIRLIVHPRAFPPTGNDAGSLWYVYVMIHSRAVEENVAIKNQVFSSQLESNPLFMELKYAIRQSKSFCVSASRSMPLSLTG